MFPVCLSHSQLSLLAVSNFSQPRSQALPLQNKATLLKGYERLERVALFITSELCPVVVTKYISFIPTESFVRKKADVSTAILQSSSEHRQHAQNNAIGLEFNSIDLGLCRDRLVSRQYPSRNTLQKWSPTVHDCCSLGFFF